MYSAPSRGHLRNGKPARGSPRPAARKGRSAQVSARNLGRRMRCEVRLTGTHAGLGNRVDPPDQASLLLPISHIMSS